VREPVARWASTGWGGDNCQGDGTVRRRRDKWSAATEAVGEGAAARREILFKIDARKMEEIIATAYKQSGFEEVILTPQRSDHGRDVIATKKGLGIIRVIDSVKAYRKDRHVEYDDIRALMGVLQTDGASKGFLTTTSDFPPELEKDSLITPFIPSRLELINGTQLRAGLIRLAEQSSERV
jgi:restriction system protein